MSYISYIRKYIGHAPMLTAGATVAVIKQNKILLILRSDTKTWGLPGGAIELGVRERMGECEFSVRDHGLGISEKDLPHIFERFYMSDRSHNARGSGLGLSIAKEIADHLGETIRVDTERGKGSAFTITAAYA